MDWNQTFFEINVLRDQVKEKALSYAALLDRAAVEPVQARDTKALQQLADGILDDEDAAYVRVTDAQGNVIFDKLESDIEARFKSQGLGDFRQRYQHQMRRDVKGVLVRPAEFKRKLANSRYRDFAQIYSDTVAKVSALVLKPKPPAPTRAALVYQDALRDSNHERDPRVTWSVAPMQAGGRQIGAVLVAFDMKRTNDGVRLKYVKGLGMVVFFVGLILTQNIIARRDKLRILDLERRYAAAKSALRSVLPEGPIRAGRLVAEGALDQARGPVDGVVFDCCAAAGGLALMIVDPDGDGIDAAAIGLHMHRTFRARRASSEPLDLETEAIALGEATRDIPLTRPVGMLLVWIGPDGGFEARGSSFAALSIVDKEVRAVKFDFDDKAAPDGVVPPIGNARGTLPVDATLLCAYVGRGEKQAHLDAAALSRYALRAGSRSVEDLATWARGRSSALAENDIAVVTVKREGAE